MQEGLKKELIRSLGNVEFLLFTYLGFAYTSITTRMERDKERESRGGDDDPERMVPEGGYPVWCQKSLTK